MKPVQPEMSAERMRAYLTEVGSILAARGLTGELVLAGGAVMVMALEARGGSGDIDAVFAYMKAWAGSPLDQRDLRKIAKALAVEDEHQAYDIVRGYSPGELPRDVQILLESLFE